MTIALVSEQLTPTFIGLPVQTVPNGPLAAKRQLFDSCSPERPDLDRKPHLAAAPPTHGRASNITSY